MLRAHAQAYADIDAGPNINDWIRNIVLGAVEDVMEELRENNDVSVMVSTMSDALFVLDKATCPHPLVISNNGLRVRNTVNKKWSTVKSAVRLCTGLHRWEIFIDRSLENNENCMIFADVCLRISSLELWAKMRDLTITWAAIGMHHMLIV